MKKNRAFSLIELIFVIAIIGVMASLGLSYMQHRAQNTKINKAAIQMQQLFQAALAYYNDKGEWPLNRNTEHPDKTFAPYIPMGMQKNPWGTDAYHFAPSPKPTDRHAAKFLIHTSHLPTKTAAIRLAAALPNAEITGGTNNEVEAEIALASPSHTSELPVFGGAGIIGDNTPIKQFQCPSNWCAHFTSAIRDINTTHFTLTGMYSVIDPDVCTTDETGAKCASSSTSYPVATIHGVNYTGDSPPGTALYIVTCTSPDQPCASS